MPLRKESILAAIEADFDCLGTVLFLMSADGVEPGPWTDEEKVKVVDKIQTNVDGRAIGYGFEELSQVDIANALGAIREAELQHREKATAVPTPLRENALPSTRINLRAALEERFLEGGKLRKQELLPDACELLLVEACLEHAVFESLTEAQAIHDLLLEALRASNERTDQCDLENLGRCLALVAKQVGVLSVTRPNT
jgi:hypothetical protein